MSAGICPSCGYPFLPGRDRCLKCGYRLASARPAALPSSGPLPGVDRSEGFGRPGRLPEGPGLGPSGGTPAAPPTATVPVPIVLVPVGTTGRFRAVPLTGDVPISSWPFGSEYRVPSASAAEVERRARRALEAEGFAVDLLERPGVGVTLHGEERSVSGGLRAERGLQADPEASRRASRPARRLVAISAVAVALGVGSVLVLGFDAIPFGLIVVYLGVLGLVFAGHRISVTVYWSDLVVVRYTGRVPDAAVRAGQPPAELEGPFELRVTVGRAVSESGLGRTGGRQLRLLVSGDSLDGLRASLGQVMLAPSPRLR